MSSESPDVDTLDVPPGLIERFNHFRQTNTWIFWTMLISSCISLTASLVLSIDAVRIAGHPNLTLSCDINSVISCGSVARSWQSSLLGFPNAFLGLMAEPVVITVAVASLAKVKFPRGFMLAAQAVYTIGFVFAYWLFFESNFVIHALCPWCLLVTLSTTLVFASITHVNIRDNNLFLPPRPLRVAREGLSMGLDFALVVVWLAIMVAIVIISHGAALFA